MLSKLSRAVGKKHTTFVSLQIQRELERTTYFLI